MSYLRESIVAVVVLLVLDAIWLGSVMGPRYKTMIAKVQGEAMQPRLWCVGLSYLMLAIGLIFFVIPRIRPSHRLRDSLVWGGLLGVVVYGVYDFTAGAVLTHWDMSLATLDVLWGGVLFAVAAFLGSWIASRSRKVFIR